MQIVRKAVGSVDVDMGGSFVSRTTDIGRNTQIEMRGGLHKRFGSLQRFESLRESYARTRQ